MENNLPTCRICLNTISDTERMVKPCSCRGSMQYVHKSCMELWLEESNIKSCSICRYRFRVTRTRRSFWEWLKSTEATPLFQQDPRVVVRLLAYSFAYTWFALSLWLNLMGAAYFMKVGDSFFRITIVISVFLVAVMKLFRLSWDIIRCRRIAAIQSPFEMADDDAAMCRICYNLTEFRETLINPCQCTGSLQYVHKSCLERQLEDTDSEYCGECFYHFQIVKTKRTFRGWMKSSGSSPLRKDQGRRVIVRLFSYTLSFIWHVLFLWMNLLGAFWFTKENNSVLGIVVMCLVSPISIGTLISLLVDFTWKFCIDFPIWREKHWHVRIRGDNDNPTN